MTNLQLLFIMLLMSEKLKNTNGESTSLRTENIDRRRFLRRAAVTTAWAVPVISTFSAAPAYAQTCLTLNVRCGTVLSCSGPVNTRCTTSGFNQCCTGCGCRTALTGGNCAAGQACVCKDAVDGSGLCPT